MEAQKNISFSVCIILFSVLLSQCGVRQSPKPAGIQRDLHDDLAPKIKKSSALNPKNTLPHDAERSKNNSHN